MDSSINVEAFNCIFRDISPSMKTGVKPGEIARMLLKRTIEVLKARGAVIRTLNLETNQLDLAVSYGMSDRFLSKGPVPWEKVIKELGKKNELRVILDPFENPCIQYPRELWEEGVRMVADTPLIMWERTIGMLRIYFTEKREISLEERKFLIFASRQGACAISEAGLLEKLRTQFDNLALQTEKMSSLGRMAAGIAHEINNPLAGILLYSSNLIKKAPKEGPLREGLQVIINETKRCKAIIQDLLEFSRMGEPRKAFVDVNEIFEKALSILENEFSLRHIRIEKHLSKKMEDVYLDEKQIQQVFVNVLLNAAQAIENKGMITIKSSVEREQKCVRVEVVDSGPGIPEDHLPRIFEPFYSTKTNGTGLGLSVSYGIIQNHKGRIQASSHAGNGTCITIDFPLPSGPLAEGTRGGQNETP